MADAVQEGEARRQYQTEVQHKYENDRVRRARDEVEFYAVDPVLRRERVELAEREEALAKSRTGRALLHLGCKCCDRELLRVMVESDERAQAGSRVAAEEEAVARLRALSIQNSDGQDIPQFQEVKYYDKYVGQVRYVGEYTSFLLDVPRWRCLLCKKVGDPAGNSLLVGCVASSPSAIVEPDRDGNYHRGAHSVWFRTDLLEEYGHERSEPGHTTGPGPALSKILFKLGKTALAKASFRLSTDLLDPLDEWLKKEIDVDLFASAHRQWTVTQHDMAAWEEQVGGVLRFRSGMFHCLGCDDYNGVDGRRYVNCTKSAMTDACVGWSSHPNAAPATSALGLDPEISRRFGKVNRAVRHELSGQPLRGFEPPPDVGPSSSRPQHNRMSCLRPPPR